MNPIFAAILFLGPNGGLDVRVEKLQGKSALSLDGTAFHKTTADIQDLRTVSVPGTGVRVFLWDEVSKLGTNHYTAISQKASTIDTVVKTSNELKLRYGSFDPLKAVLPVDSTLKANAGTSMYIVQFLSQPL